MVLNSPIRQLSLRAQSHFWVALILSALLSIGHVCRSQELGDETPAVPKPPNSRPLPDILKEGTIDTTARLYLDDSGKPILVPSETMGSFIQKTRALRDENRMPDFVFDETLVKIAVANARATLTGTFKVTLSQSQSGVVAIPLRFSSCQLFEPPQFTGGGENLIEVSSGVSNGLSGAANGGMSSAVNSGLSGYQWYLKADAGTTHSAVLKGGAVVPQRGERHELRLNLPFTQTEIEVRLPANAIDDVVSGNGEEVIERTKTKDAYIVTIRGSGGEMTVSWRESDERGRLSAVEAATQTRFEIDEPRQTWRGSTDVTLRWFGSDATDSIVLTLPQGAKWTQVPPSVSERYSVGSSAPEQPSAPEQQNATTESTVSDITLGSRKLTIRNLDPSLMQPIELELLWEWQPPTKNEEISSQPIQVPSVTIEGVTAHTGTIEFLLPIGLAPTWQEQPGTQLVQQSRPSDLFDRNQYLFRFSRQPLQLTANFRRPANVASIRPTYLVHVDNYKLQLTAWLDCMFDTTQPISIAMLPADWKIESAELVEMSAPHAPGEPLSVFQQADGSAVISHVEPDLLEFNDQRRLRQVWRVIAYRPLDPQNANRLSMELPRLRQSATDSVDGAFDHGTGILIVTSSENLLLKNSASSTKGLLVDSLVPQWQPLLANNDSKQPLVYRFQSRGAVPLWSGTAEPLPQQLVLEQQASLNVGTDSVRINQDYTLQIANEPLNQLRIAIRQDALGFQEPQVSVDGVPVPLRRINQLDSSVGTGAVSNSSGSIASDDNTTEISLTESSLSANSKMSSSVPASEVSLKSAVAEAGGVNSDPLSSEPTSNDASNPPTKPSTANLADAKLNPQASSQPDAPASSGSNGDPLNATSSPATGNSIGDTARQTGRQATSEVNPWRIFEPVSIAPLRGKVAVNVRTAIPWKAQGALQLTEIRVPLVQFIVPRATRLKEQTCIVKSDRSIEVFEKKPSGSLPVASEAEGNPEKGSRFVAASLEAHELEVGQAEVSLSARKLDSLVYLPVRIGRSWLQTIINGSERRDRYTAQIESTLPRISIRVPSNRNVKHVIVDGKPATEELTAVFTAEGTQYQIDLPNADVRTHQIEVWMISSESLSWLSPLQIDVPEIEGAQFYDRFYWQLAIPSIQHIGFASARMTPEWTWQWSGLWWNRESRLKQIDLERWVGATQQTELPLSINSYVLSSFGGGRSFQIWVVSRFMLWLPIGLTSIVVSILLISFRSLRHPALLLFGAGAIATAAMLSPDLAVLLGQTAIVSLVLVCLLLVTQAAIETRVRRRSVFTVRPSHFTERSDHFSVARNVKVAASPSSTRAHSSVIADGGK